MGGVCSCYPARPTDNVTHLTLSSFTLLRSVGRGAFGKVRIVQHRASKKEYALKYINKENCIKKGSVNHILQERNMLQRLRAPFICNLRYAFQDEEHLYMVLDLMLGGDLRFHLSKMGHLRPDMVQFYMAEMNLALDYLHAQNIVHRDVKPDNIVLDERGHVHLTDFNVAVWQKEGKALTAVAGSLAYMAPEILVKTGYNQMVDWWSLGVVFYELLFGKRPFRSKTADGLKQEIIHEQPRSPHTTPEPDAIALILLLLNKDPQKRAITMETSFRSHAFFNALDWGKLERMELDPPFKPDPKKVNFDVTHELDELLIENNPLRATSRKRKSLKAPDEAFEKEMRKMAEKYADYDYTAPEANEIDTAIPEASIDDLMVGREAELIGNSQGLNDTISQSEISSVNSTMGIRNTGRLTDITAVAMEAIISESILPEGQLTPLSSSSPEKNPG